MMLVNKPSADGLLISDLRQEDMIAILKFLGLQVLVKNPSTLVISDEMSIDMLRGGAQVVTKLRSMQHISPFRTSISLLHGDIIDRMTDLKMEAVETCE